MACSTQTLSLIHISVRSGAGLVTVATDKENISALHSHLPEAMAFDLDDKQLLEQQLQKASVVLVGPGLVDRCV